MDTSSGNGCFHPSGSAGDVDPNGDLVDELLERARRSSVSPIGECVGVDRDEHAASVARLLTAQARHLRAGARR